MEPELYNIAVDKERVINNGLAKAMKSSENEVIDMEKEKTEEEESIKSLTENLDKMKTEMESTRLKKEEDRLRLLEERRRILALRQFLHENEDCITSTASEKASLSLNSLEKKLSASEDDFTKNSINKFSQDLKDNSNQERIINEFTSNQQLERERDMNQKLQQMIIQTTIGYEDIQLSSQCYENTLFLDKKQFIYSICLKIQAGTTPPDFNVQSS